MEATTSAANVRSGIDTSHAATAHAARPDVRYPAPSLPRETTQSGKTLASLYIVDLNGCARVASGRFQTINI